MLIDSDHFNATLLIVGIDGRVLAQSAARGGLYPVVLDLRGGADLGRWSRAQHRLTPSSQNGGLDAPAVLEALDRLCPQRGCLGVVFGAGFEKDPSLLRRLSEGRRLYGNLPEVVDRLRDPGAFFPLLDRLGIQYPEVGGNLPDESGPWLLKRADSHGGAHVRPVDGDGDHASGRGYFYQRRISGRTLSITLIADGRHCRVLGVSDKWCIPQRHVTHSDRPYLYGGAISDAPLEPRQRRRLHELAHVLTEAVGLVGINSIDVLDSGEDTFVLEVNPYPGVGMELYDNRYPGGLFTHHLRACRGQLPVVNNQGGTIRGHSFVYLPGPLEIPHSWDWPWWSSGYPRARSALGAGEYLCTVHAAGTHQTGVRAHLRRREQELLSGLVTQRLTA